MILVAVSLLAFKWGCGHPVLLGIYLNLDNIESIVKLRTYSVIVQSFLFVSFSFHNVLAISRYGEYFLFLSLSLGPSNNSQALGFHC